MGEFENILSAMEPLHDCYQNIVSYHVETGRIDILRYPEGGWGWRILFHTDDDDVLRVYFLVNKLYISTGKPKERESNNPYFVCSGMNMFNFLHIVYPPGQKDKLKDLYALSVTIQTNFPQFISSFSKENLNATFDALRNTKGNNEDIINEVFLAAQGYD
jgi:hypothetical protein